MLSYIRNNMKIINLLIILIITVNSYSQNLDLVRDSILNEGLKLYQLEKVAWLSTDLILEDPSNYQLFNDYSSYFNGDTVTVVYYYHDSNDTKIKFTAKYETTKNLISENINIYEVYRNPTSKEKQLIISKKAIRDLIEDSPILSRNLNLINYNISVLENDSLLMYYLLPGTDKDDMFYMGGDYIIYYSIEKGIFKIKAQHKGLIKVKLPKGLKVYHFTHSHISGYSQFMTSTDICQAKLYGKLTVGLTEYKVISQLYESIYNSETDDFKIIKRY